MSEREGRPIVWQWQDAGSGPGHLQAVYGPAEPAADTGWPEYIRHTQSCTECRTTGTNCGEAARLQSAYRAAHRRGDVMTCDHCGQPILRKEASTVYKIDGASGDCATVRRHVGCPVRPPYTHRQSY